MEVTAKKLEYYTYEDYASWGEDAPRCELIDGVVYDMAAPTIRHQDMAGSIYRQLGNFLRGKTCRPFISPVDVRLNYDEADDIVVQPDVLVICDPKKIANGKHCLGAPDFVVEVLSPSNPIHDTVYKLGKYMQYGVREYWIVDPTFMLVMVYTFVNQQEFKVTKYSKGQKIPVGILDGLEIDLEF